MFVTQMSGVIFSRYLIRVQPVASMTQKQVRRSPPAQLRNSPIPGLRPASCVGMVESLSASSRPCSRREAHLYVGRLERDRAPPSTRPLLVATAANRTEDSDSPHSGDALIVDSLTERRVLGRIASVLAA
jgi:hypothetical protein